MTYKVVGKSITRIDILDKVLGRSKYADDLEFPGVLYAKLLRSTFPHARIMNIDIRACETVPGVKSVITAKDVPVNTFGIAVNDQVILAADKVRYLGEPVAAVAAESEEIVEDASGLIHIEYDELPDSNLAAMCEPHEVDACRHAVPGAVCSIPYHAEFSSSFDKLRMTQARGN